MEAWFSPGTGRPLPAESDVFALADLILGTHADPSATQARYFNQWEVEQVVAARTAQLREDTRSKDQFLAMLSHELRTPLMPALIAIESLQSRSDLPSDVKDLINLVARNMRLEARLVDDLLDLTRVSRAKLRLNRQPVDAHEVFRHALEVCAAEIARKQQIVRLSLDAPRATVLADASRLQQVFWNLIENAAKFTPAGGTITCRSSVERERLKIEIIDTGVGIDPELLPRIFDAFEQGGQTPARPRGGLGLGLAIARGLVEAHDGKLSAESRGQNLGSTFTLELPLAASQEHHEAPSDAPAPVAAVNGRLRLLLVEDDRDTLRLLERLLRETGYVVETATDLQSALNQLNRQPFDVLISDVSLPDGSGHDLMREARERGDVKGIALTGHANDDDLKTSQVSGFTAHITKPIDFAALQHTIELVAHGSKNA